ncbi:MAG: hypothetical protein H6678_06635 [Candidatus Delongbacteria bacterium]|nr:hypothetical protein [Candidatus Cloacimonadota bacterium]MCA9786251.1 hypothetical protein [Candidatus Cloacimonadota bacterium]MCB9473468.1 hypothetical protein [Candidatus Delongbacteria bacterium]
MSSSPEPRTHGLVLGLALCLLGGCATTAPSGWLPSAADKPADVYGSWIDLDHGEPGRSERVLGELLGVSQDSIWVLAWDGPRALACARILQGTVQDYLPDTGGTSGITLGATVVAPFANGAFALLTWPLWWVAGGVTASNLARDSRLYLPVTDWRMLASHSRFPQGLPQGLDLSTLEPRVPLSSKAPARRISPPDKRPRKAPEPGQRIRDEL